MSLAVFIDIDHDIIERIKLDPEVIACVGEYDRSDYMPPTGEAVPGQSFVDKNGIEHESWCNSHPSKKNSYDCDCGAKA